MESVGNDAVLTCRSIRELDNQGTVSVGGLSQLAIEYRPSVRGGEPQLRTRGMTLSRTGSVYGKTPRGNYIVPPLLSLEIAYTGK